MIASWRWRLYRLGLAIGGLLFAYQLWSGYQAIRANAVHISSLALLGMAWGLIAASIGFQIIAWACLMKGLNARLTWRQIIHGYTLSFLPRYIPGSVWGYLSRGQWLLQSHNVPFAVSNGGSILEVLGIVVTDCVWVGIYYASVSTGLLRLALPVLVAVIPVVIGFSLQAAPKWPVIRRSVTANKLGQNITMEISAGTWIQAVVAYLLLWLCYGGGILLLGHALGLPGSGGLVTMTFVFGLAWLSGFLVIFVPAGLGVRELALASLLAVYMGLSASQASVIAVMSRFLMSLAELAWVALAILLGPRQG